MTYELWSDGEGSFTFLPGDTDAAREVARSGAQLVWTVWARSWQDACDAKARFLLGATVGAAAED